MAEIRYTRGPDGPPLSRGRALAGPTWLGTLLPDALNAGLVQQSVAAHTGLPVAQVRRAAERGAPIIVAQGHSAAAVQQAALPALRDAGLPEHALTMMEPGSGASTGALIATIGASVVLLAIGLLTLGAGVMLTGSVILTALAAALIAAAVAVSILGVRRASQRRTQQERYGEALMASREPEQLPTFWPDLVALRREVLRTELPAAARADLWSAADALEASLLGGSGPPPDADAIGHAIARARATLADHATPSEGATADALQRLQRTSDAATRALQEARRAGQSQRSS